MPPRTRADFAKCASAWHVLPTEKSPHQQVGRTVTEQGVFIAPCEKAPLKLVKFVFVTRKQIYEIIIHGASRVSLRQRTQFVATATSTGEGGTIK